MYQTSVPPQSAPPCGCLCLLAPKLSLTYVINIAEIAILLSALALFKADS